jgi:hypothetical protein
LPWSILTSACAARATGSGLFEQILWEPEGARREEPTWGAGFLEPDRAAVDRRVTASVWSRRRLPGVDASVARGLCRSRRELGSPGRSALGVTRCRRRRSGSPRGR